MLKEFVNKVRIFDYATIFSAKGDINLPLKSRACFADVINRDRIYNEIYDLYLIRDPCFSIDEHKSNLCFLTKEELKKHIFLARRLFPFTYSVKEVEYEGYNAFKVHLNLSCKHFYHRYLLAWIRYAYEFPYNVILNDALRMKHCYLKKDTISNLFVLCANCYNCGIDTYGTGHSISNQYSLFLKEKELKIKLSDISKTALFGLNNIYNRDYHINGLYKYNKVDDDENYRYLEYWSDNDEFEKRAKVYLKAYKAIKKL